MDPNTALYILEICALVFFNVLCVTMIAVLFMIAGSLNHLKRRANDTFDAVQGAAFSAYDTFVDNRNGLLASVAGLVSNFLSSDSRKRRR